MYNDRILEFIAIYLEFSEFIYCCLKNFRIYQILFLFAQKRENKFIIVTNKFFNCSNNNKSL